MLRPEADYTFQGQTLLLDQLSSVSQRIHTKPRYQLETRCSHKAHGHIETVTGYKILQKALLQKQFLNIDPIKSHNLLSHSKCYEVGWVG